MGPRTARRRLAAFLGVILLAASASPVGESARGKAAPTGLVVGIVVDAATGAPVSRAIVSMAALSAAPRSSRPGEPAVPGLPRILTGPDGRFVYRDLPPGNYNVMAAKVGYADGAHGRHRPGGPSVPLALSAGERTDGVVVRLWKHASISGAVLDEAGEPLVRIRVRAWRRSFVGGRHTFVGGPIALTDDRGIYRLIGLVPGLYVVAVPSPQGLAPAARIVHHDDHGSPLPPGTPGALRVGTSTYNMVGVPGAPVPPPSLDGRVAVYPTTYYPSAASLAQAGAILISSGEERLGIDLQLQPVSTSRVSGMLSRPAGPVAGIPLRLVPAGSEEATEDLQTAATDGSGAFTFPAVPAGQYSLRVMAVSSTGHEQTLLTTLWAEAPVVVASDIDDVALTLRTGIRITGTLGFDGSTRKPPLTVNQVPLRIESQDRPGLAIPSDPVRVDATGQFATGGLPPGRYFVRVAGSPVGWMFKAAMHNGRDVSESPVELHTDDVHVVLTYTDRWTGIAGSVTSADGALDADAIVLVFPADQAQWTNYGATPRRLKGARTTKSGDYNVTSLPPGNYYVVALPDEQAADWPEPDFLRSLVRFSTRLTIGEGEQKTQSLRTQVIR